MGHNNYFNFKQFTVIQEKTAMRVGVDGVLLGAWAPVDYPTTILDVGTGTGLLALMMAQRFPDAIIDAVEIDADAAEEARFNVSQSKWADRIQVFHTSFQDFAVSCSHKYDLIISNPPYFKATSGIKCGKREQARDNKFLSLEDLIGSASGLLSEKGVFCFIYPYSELTQILQFVEKNKLSICNELLVRSSNESKFIRVLLKLSHLNCDRKMEELILYEGVHHQKTEDYRNIISPFH